MHTRYSIPYENETVSTIIQLYTVSVKSNRQQMTYHRSCTRSAESPSCSSNDAYHQLLCEQQMVLLKYQR